MARKAGPQLAWKSPRNAELKQPSMLEKESMSVLALFYPHDLPRFAFTGHYSLATGHYSLATGHDLPAANRSAGNWLRLPATFGLDSS